jgi:oligopeptide/dipeptide ABC transporter ATP-binding protein
MTALLEIDHLVRRFPVKAKGGRRAVPAQLHAVDGVSFIIERGETIGLVGESGCGKSTLVRLISRLLDPTEGTIRFAGQDIGQVPARQFGRTAGRARIQMVFQDATDSLNPRFTAFAAIADPLRRLKRLGGTALDARVKELATLCGLPEALLSRFPHQLSGGQKARVGIARAIAVEPELLILDEPTSALDVSVQVVILHLLEDLKRRLGMSYLFVSHDLNVVRLICDRVLVMYLGKIVESGPADRLFDAPAHPYTKALLSAIPHFEPGAKRVGQRLSGEPRSPIDPDPNVCRFYGRCPKGEVRCHTEMPKPVAIEPGRLVACHFPETVVAPVEDVAPPPRAAAPRLRSVP